MGVISSFFILVKSNKLIAIGGLVALGYALPILYEYLVEKSPAHYTEMAAVSAQADQRPSNISKDNELLIELQPGFSINELDNLRSTYELHIERAFNPLSESVTDLDDYYTVDIPEKYVKNIDDISNALRAKRAVEWVEFNEELSLDPVETNNEVISPPIKKYVVNDPMNIQKWEYSVLQMNEFYQYIKTQKLKPRKKAKLFILDTGVDGNHEDLKKQYKSYEDSSSKDDVGHGTHCAGVAAAVSNNKIGISSLVPNNSFVEISAVKVLSGFGFGTQKMIIDGMIKAIDAGADVISMSLGGKSTEPREKAYTEVVQYALKHNVIVITAAGNSGRDASQYCPANSEGVIAVSAVDQSLKRTAFSNTLQHIKYGLAAPGKDIYSTFPKDQYKVYSGTSMAAPQVAGLISVLRSLKPEMTVHEAFRLLDNSGMELSEPFKTGNLIQPFNAVKLLNQEMLN